MKNLDLSEGLKPVDFKKNFKQLKDLVISELGEKEFSAIKTQTLYLKNKAKELNISLSDLVKKSKLDTTILQLFGKMNGFYDGEMNGLFDDSLSLTIEKIGIMVDSDFKPIKKEKKGYSVVLGDTLRGIAAKEYGLKTSKDIMIKVNEIVAYNKSKDNDLGDPNRLQIGQVILLDKYLSEEAKEKEEGTKAKEKEEEVKAKEKEEGAKAKEKEEEAKAEEKKEEAKPQDKVEERISLLDHEEWKLQEKRKMSVLKQDIKQTSRPNFHNEEMRLAEKKAKSVTPTNNNVSLIPDAMANTSLPKQETISEEFKKIEQFKTQRFDDLIKLEESAFVGVMKEAKNYFDNGQLTQQDIKDIFMPRSSESLAFFLSTKYIEEKFAESYEHYKSHEYYGVIYNDLKNTFELRNNWKNIDTYMVNYVKFFQHDDLDLVSSKSLFQGEKMGLPNKKGNHNDAIDVFFKVKSKNPDGIEIGPDICSVNGGVVIAAGKGWKSDGNEITGGLSPKGGNAVIIYNPQTKEYSYYAHMNEVKVEVGDIISAGSVIGIGGNTGLNAFKEGRGSHVHFEIHKYTKDGKNITFSQEELRKRLSSKES